MTIRRIGYKESLDAIWDELTFTRARLEADPQARDLAPNFTDVTGRLFQVKQAQYKCWEAEIVAEAHVSAVDYTLDAWVDDFARIQDRIVGHDHNHPRWTRYFGNATPGSIRRLGLASEMQRVGGWQESLCTEREAELKQQAERLEKILDTGRAALDARAKAAAARADHRSREILSFIDDVNALRLSLYGELIGRVGKNKQDRRWPEEFFAHGTASPRRPAAEPTTPGETE